LLRGEAVEDMNVYAAAHGAALGPDQKPPWRLCDQTVDCLGELVHQSLVEQVQRGAIDAQDSQGAIVIEAYEAHCLGSIGARAYTSVFAGARQRLRAEVARRVSLTLFAALVERNGMRAEVAPPRRQGVPVVRNVVVGIGEKSI